MGSLFLIAIPRFGRYNRKELITKQGGQLTVSYQALYRVWRPQKFQDMVGQEVVVKTLKKIRLLRSK